MGVEWIDENGEKQLYWEFDDVVKWVKSELGVELIEGGFNCDSWWGRYGNLRIAVIFGDGGYRLDNTICAEHEEHFDKWTKAYYSQPFPTSEKECELIRQELDEIQKEEHVHKGLNFESFNREISDEIS